MTRGSLALREARALHGDARGVSAVEFALVLPLLLLTLFGGLETANLVAAHMRINQIAISLADNASRLKQQTISGAPRVREYDVNEAFKAAERQGQDINLVQNGRMILSSLETNASGGQWIHWQRCKGNKTNFVSSDGTQGTGGSTGTSFDGMGPVGKKVTAEPNSAVMVAEVVYEYQPLVDPKIFGSIVIRKSAAMYVRDDRDLSGTGIFNPTPTATPSIC